MLSRVLVQHLTSFESSKKSVVWHIGSDYAQEMSTKSEVVSKICKWSMITKIEF